MVLALVSCRRVERKADSRTAAAADAGGGSARRGMIALPTPALQVVGLVPTREGLALVVWQDAASLWATTPTATRRLGVADADASAAWDGERLHVISSTGRWALAPDGTPLAQSKGVPGHSRIALADAERVVAIRQRCDANQQGCKRFADVSVDHGATWLPEQPLKLVRGEPLQGLVGFMDSGTPTWVERSVPTLVRRVDGAGLVHTVGKLPLGMGEREGKADAIAHTVWAGTPDIAACSGAPARVAWRERLPHELRVGTVTELLSGKVPAQRELFPERLELLCAGDELLLAAGPRAHQAGGVGPLELLASHDGGRSFSVLAVPVVWAPGFGFAGRWPRVRLYFGNHVEAEGDPSLDVHAEDAQGRNIFPRGKIRTVEGGPGGFGGRWVSTGIRDLSLVSVGIDTPWFDVDSWRLVQRPDGGSLLVWLELALPEVEQFDPREITAVGWRVEPEVRD